MIGTSDAQTEDVASGCCTGQASGESDRYRVLFMFRLRPGTTETFLTAYETVRHEVAALPGHLGDQVCQSETDADQWMITSEWESAEHFLSWERSPGHRELAAPMLACMAERSSQRYFVRTGTRVVVEVS
jgi:heme-degrading monooxygenase HmoA